MENYEVEMWQDELRRTEAELNCISIRLNRLSSELDSLIAAVEEPDPHISTLKEIAAQAKMINRMILDGRSKMIYNKKEFKQKSGKGEKE